MDELLMEELMAEVKEHNQIQKGIRQELELQNDLKVSDMLNDERFCNRDFVRVNVNGAARERLYAQLSDEDRKILKYYRRVNGNPNGELELYNITVKGCLYEYKESEEDKGREFVERLHGGILLGVYTEKELYEYFERIFERSGYSLLLLGKYWEEKWEKHKIGLIDNDEKGTRFNFDDANDEEIEEWKKEIMEKYENRITKAYAEEQKEYE